MAGGSELGSAHVSIFPQMKGFRQNVAKETGKAVSDLKNAFSKGFNGVQQWCRRIEFRCFEIL